MADYFKSLHTLLWDDVQRRVREGTCRVFDLVVLHEIAESIEDENNL